MIIEEKIWTTLEHLFFGAKVWHHLNCRFNYPRGNLWCDIHFAKPWRREKIKMNQKLIFVSVFGGKLLLRVKA